MRTQPDDSEKPWASYSSGQPSRGEDRPAAELDDLADREELRDRYYGLLQELRVILPGVEVLVAFLLTVPFASRFGQLDDLGRASFAVAMLASVIAVVCMLTPTVFHRVAPRTLRSDRLVWAIRTVLGGLSALVVALLAALLCVGRFVYGSSVGLLMTVCTGLVVVVLWLAVPLAHRVRE